MNCIRLSLLALTLAFQQPAVFAQPSVTEGVPALKVTAPNGASSVLIGSLHIPSDGLRQPAASVMDGAKRYVVEGMGPDPHEVSPVENAPK
jgi:hypothetical protein